MKHEFELLNKNEKLAVIEVTDNYSTITDVVGRLPEYLCRTSSWIDARTAPSSRKNITELLRIAGAQSKHEYARLSHNISLTDTLWTRELGSDTTWEAVNPYNNMFNRLISEMALDGVYNGGNVNTVSPDYTLDGSADKCWKRDKGQINLYKTLGEKWSGIVGNRPYCEYYASQVANQLITDKSHFVQYDIKVIKTENGYNKPYVYCPIFTSEASGYVPYADSKYSGTGLQELDINLDERSRTILREMLVLDSIILNFDRHGGNYGFIVDNGTFELKGMAPIFDQDCSLGAFVSLQSAESMQEAYEIAMINKPRAEIGDYVDQARWGLTDKIVSNMKNMYPFHFDKLPADIDVEAGRIEFMEYIVNSQIKAIL